MEHKKTPHFSSSSQSAEKAAELELTKKKADALFNQGIRQLQEKDGQEGLYKAAHCFSEAAKLGHIIAAEYLAYCCFDDAIIATTYVPWFKEMAKAEDQEDMQRRAIFFLGYCHYYGKCAYTQSYEKAAKLFYKIWTMGMVGAQYHLALCCLLGRTTVIGQKDLMNDFSTTYSPTLHGTSKTDKANFLAEKFARLAADRGYAEAQYLLGMIRLEKDFGEACQYFNKAAQQGHVEAQNALRLFSYEFCNGFTLTSYPAHLPFEQHQIFKLKISDQVLYFRKQLESEQGSDLYHLNLARKKNEIMLPTPSASDNLSAPQGFDANLYSGKQIRETKVNTAKLSNTQESSKPKFLFEEFAQFLPQDTRNMPALPESKSITTKMVQIPVALSGTQTKTTSSQTQTATSTTTISKTESKTKKQVRFAQEQSKLVHGEVTILKRPNKKPEENQPKQTTVETTTPKKATTITSKTEFKTDKNKTTAKPETKVEVTIQNSDPIDSNIQTTTPPKTEPQNLNKVEDNQRKKKTKKKISKPEPAESKLVASAAEPKFKIDPIAESSFKNGVKLYWQGDTTSALSTLIAIKEKYPPASVFLVHLMEQKSEPSKERTKQTKKTLDYLNELQQKDANSYYCLGLLNEYIQQNKAKAVSFYERCIELDPTHAEGHYRLGLVYSRGASNVTKNRNMALQHYNQAISNGHMQESVKFNLNIITKEIAEREQLKVEEKSQALQKQRSNVTTSGTPKTGGMSTKEVMAFVASKISNSPKLIGYSKTDSPVIPIPKDELIMGSRKKMFARGVKAQFFDDHITAKSWLEVAASADHVLACLYYGIILLKENKVSEAEVLFARVKKEINWFLDATTSARSESLFWTGLYCEFVLKETDKEYSDFILTPHELYLKSALKYEASKDPKAETKQRIAEIEAAGVKGELQSEFRLGELYLQQQMLEHAYYWFERAAYSAHRGAKTHYLSLRETLNKNQIAKSETKSSLSLSESKWPATSHTIMNNNFDKGKKALYLKHYSFAETNLKKAADAGNFVACLYYAYMLNDENRNEEAARYFQQAKNNRDYFINIPSDSNLLLVRSGIYLELESENEPQKTVGTYAKGFTSPLAQYHLGIHYFKKADYKRATQFFEKTFTSEADSCYHLGICYLNGWGKDKNPDLAFSLFQQAADRGHMHAWYYLGLFYAKEPQLKDLKRAYKYFGLAAIEGQSTNAYYSLAECCYYGLGTGKNLIRAEKYLTIAASRGHTEAQNLLSTLKETSTKTTTIAPSSSNFFSGPIITTKTSSTSITLAPE